MQFDFIKNVDYIFWKKMYFQPRLKYPKVCHTILLKTAGQGPLSGDTVPKKKISAILNLLKFMLFGIEMNFKNS